MHNTPLVTGEGVSKIYGGPGKVVLDVGGQDINGSLRSFFESAGMKYICLDMVEHHSVDIVVKPGDPFPFQDGTIDLVVSTSCFEHDPCFWMTFREIARVVKEGGFIYVNAPSNGPYHGYPGDNWRFYGDAGQALAHWSGRVFQNVSYPTEVVETFHVIPYNTVYNDWGGVSGWNDFVCVWKRVSKATDAIVNAEVRNTSGKLENYLRNVKGCSIHKMKHH
jgi:SAM-dependent methyltransferase